MGAVRTAGRFAAPAAWGKRVDTCGFYPLNSRFPLFLNLAQTRDRRPLRKWGTAEDFFFRRGGPMCPPISIPLRNARFLSSTHTVLSPQARHTRVAQLVGLAVTDGTCEYSSVRTLYLVISSLSTLHSSLYCTRKKRKAFAFLSPIYNLLYPLGVTIASSGVPAAQSGQALPRTKFR